MLSLGEGNDKLLDEGSHIPVGNNLAFPFLHGKSRCRDFDRHVVLDLHLTSEAPVVLHFLACEMHAFGRQRLSAAFNYTNTALSAAAFAAARRRKEYIVVCHSRQ